MDSILLNSKNFLGNVQKNEFLKWNRSYIKKPKELFRIRRIFRIKSIVKEGPRKESEISTLCRSFS